MDIQRKDAGCRTLYQYNKEPISGEDMRKLQEIAQDYRSVKNYVYARYGGIKSLSKLYPGYTVQNEMTKSGLRAELGLPSVYFYRAVFDALGDIKSQWARTKTKIVRLVGQNENLTAQEKHYLRFLLKSSNAFAAVLNQHPICLPQQIQTQLEQIAGQVDAEKLHRYLCRQVRKYHVRDLCTDRAGGFFITERAYRYGAGNTGQENTGKEKAYGIYIATKENRKRIFVPLTDPNAYQKQLYIKLLPEKSGIEIHIPMEIKVKNHRDYNREVGISAGIWCMFTTHEGHVYGADFGKLHQELVEYMSLAASSYRREKDHNPGRRKYNAKRARLDARIESYVNHEINRMILEEKPKTIYLPKLPGKGLAGHNRKINYSVGLWRKGLIRERLKQKCLEHSIELVEVFGKGISTQCSCCGAAGKYSRDTFYCESCGYETDKKVNAAKNALKRGQEQPYNDHTPAPEEEEESI